MGGGGLEATLVQTIDLSGFDDTEAVVAMHGRTVAIAEARVTFMSRGLRVRES